MNATSSTNSLHSGPGDGLDRLLSEFFKSQMKHPWPSAPVVVSEPSELVAARATSADAPRHQPVERDSSRRARFTLAASVALLLGTGWLLTDGYRSGDRPVANPARVPSGVAGGTAGDSEVLKKIREEKARNGDGFVIPKADPPKFD